jgi:Ca2+-binding EF-hand superfamily protein
MKLVIHWEVSAMHFIHSHRSALLLYPALIPVLLCGCLFAQTDAKVDEPQPITSIRAIGIGLDCDDLMRQLDADADGFITQAEWQRVFTKYDTNADQRLSADEVRAISSQTGKEQRLGPDYGRIEAFERLDKNRDEAISTSEWPGKEKDFNLLDANRNGSISREEFLAKNGRWWNETFDNLDFNDNHVIDRSEWLDSEASFNRLDHDNNGVIEEREFYNPR